MAEMQLINVEYRTESTHLLGPLTFDIPQTGVTTILGTNGAGKSLVLALLHGLISPSRGQVLWQGQNTKHGIRQRGFVFQKAPVLRRSVADNIRFPLLNRNLPRKEQTRMLEQALHQSRLIDKAGQPAAALSGGELQRMALARAMVTRPQAILLDEPAASLDPASTKALEQMIRTIAASGVTVVMATHDIPQARRLADHVLFLSHGKVCEHRPALDFFASPKTKEAIKYLEGLL